jgi:hypothetical protein
MKTFNGKRISFLMTINSMYANGMIEAVDDAGEHYRIPIETLLPIIHKTKFNVDMKRKYKHLTIKEEV